MNFDLTIEQQFELRKIRDESQNLSRENAIKLLLEVTELAFRRESVIKSLVMEKARGIA